MFTGGVELKGKRPKIKFDTTQSGNEKRTSEGYIIKQAM